VDHHPARVMGRFIGWACIATALLLLALAMVVWR
jgi:hypothetical protein